MAKDKGMMLIETLIDGTEIENFFPDSEMAETVLKTRKRFRKATKTDKFDKTETPTAGLPEEKVIKAEPEKKAKVSDNAVVQGITLEKLIELGAGSNGRKRLIAMAKKLEVSAGGKNEEIAQHIYDKSLENLQKD